MTVLRLFGGSGDVRRDDDARMADERRGAGRFGIEHIEGGAGHVAVFEGGEQGFGDNHFATGAIHHAHTGTREGESVGVDHAAGFGSERAVEGEEVARLEQFVETDEADTALGGCARRDVGVGSEQSHLVGLPEPGDRRADPSETDDAERFPAQFDTGEFLFLPEALLHRGVGRKDVASQSSEKSEGVFGDTDGIAAGRVHHDDTAARGGLDIDVVDADAGAADDAKLPGAVEQLGRDARGGADQHGVGVGDGFGDRRFRPQQAHDLPGGIRGAQDFFGSFRDVFGDNDLHVGPVTFPFRMRFNCATSQYTVQRRGARTRSDGDARFGAPAADKAVVGGGREQFGDTALQQRMAQFRCDFVQGNEDEAAIGEARVGNDEFGSADDARSVEEDVDIDGARAHGHAATAAERPLDLLQAAEKLERHQGGFGRDGAVQEGALIDAADRLGEVDGGLAERADAGLGQSVESARQMSGAVADVRSEGEIDRSHRGHRKSGNGFACHETSGPKAPFKSLVCVAAEAATRKDRRPFP